MKKLFCLFIVFTTLLSCSSNETIVLSNDRVVGDWSLFSQKVNGSETATTCTKQTVFSFTSNGILRQVFYTEVNGNCSNNSQIISKWSIADNSKYIIESANGNTRTLEFFFTDNDTKFSVSETDANNNQVLSVFVKS